MTGAGGGIERSLDGAITLWDSPPVPHGRTTHFAEGKPKASGTRARRMELDGAPTGKRPCFCARLHAKSLGVGARARPCCLSRTDLEAVLGSRTTSSNSVLKTRQSTSSKKPVSASKSYSSQPCLSLRRGDVSPGISPGGDASSSLPKTAESSVSSESS